MNRTLKESTSFTQTLNQGRYYADISADLKHGAYVVSGELIDRKNTGDAYAGLVKAKHGVFHTEQFTDLDDDGCFSIRLKAGAKYMLEFHLNHDSFGVELELY